MWVDSRIVCCWPNSRIRSRVARGSDASWPGPVVTYRWRDSDDMFYWVYLDDHGVVRRAHPGMEFHNAPDRN